MAAKKEKEIAELQAKLAEVKNKVLGPGEIEEVLIHKFLKTKDFYD